MPAVERVNGEGALEPAPIEHVELLRTTQEVDDVRRVGEQGITELGVRKVGDRVDRGLAGAGQQLDGTLVLQGAPELPGDVRVRAPDLGRHGAAEDLVQVRDGADVGLAESAALESLLHGAYAAARDRPERVLHAAEVRIRERPCEGTERLGVGREPVELRVELAVRLVADRSAAIPLPRM